MNSLCAACAHGISTARAASAPCNVLIKISGALVLPSKKSVLGYTVSLIATRRLVSSRSLIDIPFFAIYCTSFPRATPPSPSPPCRSIPSRSCTHTHLRVCVHTSPQSKKRLSHYTYTSTRFHAIIVIKKLRLSPF